MYVCSDVCRRPRRRSGRLAAAQSLPRGTVTAACDVLDTVSAAHAFAAFARMTCLPRAQALLSEQARAAVVALLQGTAAWPRPLQVLLLFVFLFRVRVCACARVCVRVCANV